MWLRTQNNTTADTLVNLEHCEILFIDGAAQVVAGLPGGGRIRRTYFEGPDAERLAAAAVAVLWGELRAGIRFIDMASVCAEALERCA